MTRKTMHASRLFLAALLTVLVLTKGGCTFTNHVEGDQHNSLGVPSGTLSGLAAKVAK